MISVEVNNDDPPKDDSEHENENEKARLREISVYEYHNTNRKSNKKKTNNKYKCLIVTLITTFILLLFFLISYKALDIIYADDEDEEKINTTTTPVSENMTKTKVDNIPIIDDVKNIVAPLVPETEGKPTTPIPKKKIGLAFVYSTLYSNGIARFITVTANLLMKTGKYDIIFITGKRYSKEYDYDKRIKRFYAHGNYTVIKDIILKENIDIFVIQNDLTPSVIKFYKNMGKKVIGMFHGVYLSPISHGTPLTYKSWHIFDDYDSYIFIDSDDYYVYKRLDFKNEVYIPNLYTFEPANITNSNLTYNNILMLGRLNDPIKGAEYAVKAMPYVIKEVPDARLILLTSDSRIEFLRVLIKNLNLTNNVFIHSHTYNISSYFWNTSVLWYTSLSEAFPMAMNEAKAHGLPIVAFDVPYSPPYQSGVLTVEPLDLQSLARETVKLLKNYDYRKKMGEISKHSLNKFSNVETIKYWEKLIDALLSKDNNDYKKFQAEMEYKYYDEANARKHLENHFNFLINYDRNMSCFTFENLMNKNYIRNIKPCNITKK